LSKQEQPGRLVDMNEYDVAVVGGGAAGLSAALVLTRARRQVVVIDSGEPRNAPAAHMQGFLSREGMPPTELLAAGREEVAGYGGHLLATLGCDTHENGWVVADPAGRTTVAGVWVAGNAANPRAQVISAAGEGSAAAIALNADLVDEEVHTAMRDFRAGLPA
jgi:thioredoxin reductase